MITEKHAHLINKQKNDLHKLYPKHPKAKTIIGEIDGAMTPIVETSKEAKDARKDKTVLYKETKLSLAYAQGSINPFYNATMGSVDEAGDQLYSCVKAVGNPRKSRIHCVTDGAVWIADQIERLFGHDVSHLIDFYHLSEYLSGAAHCISPADQSAWLRQMQQFFKENKITEVIKELKDHMNKPNKNDHECKADKCYQYIIKRLSKFDYKSALDQELPIGSGRIESGNRSIVQQRLKIPGAWWLSENADAMLSLRTIRANGLWDDYWRQHAAYKNTALRH